MTCTDCNPPWLSPRCTARPLPLPRRSLVCHPLPPSFLRRAALQPWAKLRRVAWRVARCGARGCVPRSLVITPLHSQTPALTSALSRLSPPSPLVSQAGGAAAMGEAQAGSVAGGAVRGERVRASLPGYHPAAQPDPCPYLGALSFVTPFPLVSQAGGAAAVHGKDPILREERTCSQIPPPPSGDHELAVSLAETDALFSSGSSPPNLRRDQILAAELAAQLATLDSTELDVRLTRFRTFSSSPWPFAQRTCLGQDCLGDLLDEHPLGEVIQASLDHDAGATVVEDKEMREAFCASKTYYTLEDADRREIEAGDEDVLRKALALSLTRAASQVFAYHQVLV